MFPNKCGSEKAIRKAADQAIENSRDNHKMKAAHVLSDQYIAQEFYQLNNEGGLAMTKPEEMKRLEADLASDKDLKEKFEKTVDRIAGEGKVQSDGELFAKAAGELGYSITAADFERLDADGEEVDLDELESSAGGKGEKDEYGHDIGCIAVWHCYTAMLHTETESKEVLCWKHYACFAINKHKVNLYVEKMLFT